jgi:hypothetical protein
MNAAVPRTDDAELVLVLRVARNQVRLCSLKGLAGGPFPRREIAPLYFGYDPMQQARPDHFMLAKFRHDVIEEGVALGDR